jgi:hypothetical protein
VNPIVFDIKSGKLTDQQYKQAINGSRCSPASWS